MNALMRLSRWFFGMRSSMTPQKQMIAGGQLIELLN
jgi:hypothetical protein